MRPDEVARALESVHGKAPGQQGSRIDEVVAEAHRIVHVVDKLGSILPILETVYPQLAPINDVLQKLLATAPKILGK